ncbi:MAG: hypothetical protein WC930_03310 [Candidatus Paceibacterota bacterium]|jgi:hypothetical protein
MERIIGIVFIGAGLLFFFNNKKISKGAFWFSQKLYTEDNLKIIFKVLENQRDFGEPLCLIKE